MKIKLIFGDIGNIMDKINWFFKSPRVSPLKGELHSQLYLLRRDIDTCFGTNPNTGYQLNPIDKVTHNKIYCKAIWPGAMCILAGIDLLGKFLTGSDKSFGSREDSGKWRFENFAKRYIDVSDSESSILYQLRNSLLHSFGLYSEEVDKKGNVKTTYNFIVSQGFPYFIKHIENDYFQVDVQILREKFSMAIDKYEKDLKDNSREDFEELNQNFIKMYPKHAKPMLCINQKVKK